MLTLFTIPKAFEGLNDVIQRNAIKSWTLLRPECDIVLIGDDPGTKEAASEFGLRHLPDVVCNEYGTPRVDSIYQSAAESARYDVLCHVNADIILMNDLMAAVEKVTAQHEWFLLTGQRWNLDIDQPLEFSNGWEEELRSLVAKKGKLGARTGMDYLVFPRRFTQDIPPFAIGRTAYDQWFIYRARIQGAAVVDATPVVLDIHQNHDYSHHATAVAGTSADIERRRNLELAGGQKYLLIIKDRTAVLTSSGLKTPFDLWRVWRFIRTAQVLRSSTPFPAGLLLRAVNLAVDNGRKTLVALRLLSRGKGPWARQD